MELEVLEEKENPFFGRKELKIELKHASAPTPSKQELIKELASRYSLPEENIVVDYIFGRKGLASSIAKVKLYKEKPKAFAKKVEKVEKSETQANEAK